MIMRHRPYLESDSVSSSAAANSTRNAVIRAKHAVFTVPCVPSATQSSTNPARPNSPVVIQDDVRQVLETLAFSVVVCADVPTTVTSPPDVNAATVTS
jgi:hypothetical protein